MSFSKRLRKIEKEVEAEKKSRIEESFESPFGETPESFFADLIPVLEAEIESQVKSGGRMPYRFNICWWGSVGEHNSGDLVSLSWRSFARWFYQHNSRHQYLSEERTRIFMFVEQAPELIAALWHQKHPDVRCITPKGPIPEKSSWDLRFEW